MSDYRFGDDYKLNIYPEEAIGYGGELDMDKVESVEIEWVDFVRKSEDKSRWSKLFGTPEMAARTLADKQLVYAMQEYDALLGWLRGDAE